MTAAVTAKLFAIFLTVGLGWAAARARWLGDPQDSAKAVRVLSAVAFNLFVPALLFRTMARLDLAALPGRTLAAYFVPACAFLLAVYALQRGTGRTHGPAAPATRAIGATYGNAVQLGIPLAAALFGEVGLGVHIALVSVHGLLLLTLLTVLAEADLARVDHRATWGSTLRSTVRNTIIHPVVLPVLLGLAWNLAGFGLHPVIDQTLQGLGAAVVPVCLVLIGASLQAYGLQGRLAGAVGLSAAKLLVLPALVLVVARWGFGLDGTALNVAVMMAALPVGSNALLFAQRYATLEGEATAAIVLSTLAFVVTASLWLAVLAAVGP
jgi:predicted permease